MLCDQLTSMVTVGHMESTEPAGLFMLLACNSG
uniref:Uncharacterized protein n=1 Tax=Anguilla anguilla TaxID=7936 RepID=A0A0E9RRN2_ANGAN